MMDEQADEQTPLLGSRSSKDGEYEDLIASSRSKDSDPKDLAASSRSKDSDPKDLIASISSKDSGSTDSVNKNFSVIVAGYAFLCMTILLCTLPMSYLAIDLKEKKDISETSSSIILSVYTYAYVISCIVTPKLDDRFNSQLLMVVFSSVLLLVQILFAYLMYIPSGFVIPAAITIRTISGFSAGVYENVFAAWVIRRYKEHIGTIVSVAEAVISAGFLTGPLAGGILFKKTGSLCKTQLFGLVPATLFYAGFTIIVIRSKITEDNSSSNSKDGTQNKGGSFIKILKSWQLLYVFSQTFWLTLFECTPTGVLAPYLQPIYTNYSAAFLAGIILSGKGIAYTMASIPTGYLTDKPRFAFTTFIFYVLAPLIIGSGYIVSGLQTFVPSIKPSFVRLVVPFLSISFGAGMGSGPMLRFILSLWKGFYPKETADYTTYLTSVFLVTYSLGEAVGVNLGGVLYGVITFEQILSILGCVALAYFLANVIFILSLHNKPYMIYVRLHNPSEELINNPAVQNT